MEINKTEKIKEVHRIQIIQNLVEDFETELENMDIEELKNLYINKGYTRI